MKTLVILLVTAMFLSVGARAQGPSPRHDVRPPIMWGGQTPCPDCNPNPFIGMRQWHSNYPHPWAPDVVLPIVVRPGLILFIPRLN